jgi:hypothetical protein
MSDIKIVIILSSLGLLVVTIEMIRRRHLREKYALVWLLIPALTILVTLIPGVLEKTAHLIGVFYPPALAFVIALGFLVLICLMLSVVISHQTDRIIRLTQEISLLKNRLDKLEKPSRKSTKN